MSLEVNICYVNQETTSDHVPVVYLDCRLKKSRDLTAVIATPKWSDCDLYRKKPLVLLWRSLCANQQIMMRWMWKTGKYARRAGLGRGGVGVDAKITLLNKAYTSEKIHLEWANRRSINRQTRLSEYGSCLERLKIEKTNCSWKW